MTLSFRARLTLRWLAAFGLILTLTNVAIYLGTRAFLLRELDAQLRTLAATELASAVDEPTDGIHLHEFAIDPRPGEEYADKFVQLIDRQGAVLLQSPRLGSSPALLPAEAFSDALSGRAPVVDVVALGRQGRMIGLATRGRDPYVVAVGLYTDQIDGRLARLRTLLVLVWIGGLGVTAVVGFTLASRALQPIQRITQTAAAIAEGQFAERLDPPAIDDEIGRMTRLLNQMLERLHGAIAANQRFAADASHELRSPLTAMQGEIELALKRDRSPEEYRQALTVLGERLRVMTALTDDLMLLVRTQEHAPPPTREVPLAPLLHRVAERTAGIAAQVGVQISVDVPQGLIVYGEAALLERVFDNLMRNAVQYNHPQGVVRVTASLQPAQGQWVSDEVLVTVANTGASVPEAERERVFERFYRLDPSRSRLTGGSGLGLAISREIVRLFKGTIRVGDQRPGTTIEVRLKGTA